jgi:hypothetical protein|tara:strand:- start:635 stop:919 length:285 start_codon:yes stop_codon:yes gene_type:complete
MAETNISPVVYTLQFKGQAKMLMGMAKWTLEKINHYKFQERFWKGGRNENDSELRELIGQLQHNAKLQEVMAEQMMTGELGDYYWISNEDIDLS